MNAECVVDLLLDADRPACLEALLGEASVHRPHRGTRWLAAFQDETGHQVWKATGLTDRTAAQAIADEWEALARQKRAAQPKKPTIRVRPGSPEREAGLLSQAEVSAKTEPAPTLDGSKPIYLLIHTPLRDSIRRRWFHRPFLPSVQGVSR